MGKRITAAVILCGMMLLMTVFVVRERTLTENKQEIKWEESGVIEARDIFLIKGSRGEYREGVRAWGKDGRDLTAEIVVDASWVITDRTGIYPLTYRVEDEDGSLLEIEVKVHVVEGEQAVELQLQEQLPAFVGIRSRINDEKKSLLWGSGFILKLEGDSAVILTAAHVTGQEDEVEVLFYDGRIHPGTIVKKKEETDLALVRVRLPEESRELLKELREVKVEPGRWEEIGEDAAIGYCYRPPGEEQWVTRTGRLLEKESQLWATTHPAVHYSVENEQGASGSAVLDESGALIAMALGYTKEEGKRLHWGIGLPIMLEFLNEK